MKILKWLGKGLLGFVLLIAVLVGALMLVPNYSQTIDVDFTRHLQALDAGAEPAEQTFFSVEGEGRVIIDGLAEGDSIGLTLNGAPVPLGAPAQGRIEAPVTLLADNAVTVVMNGNEASQPTLRVKQWQTITHHVAGRIHFNTNVSDFEAARLFYRQLGFTSESGFPDANTLSMARAMGIYEPTEYDGSQGGEAGGYLLHGKIMGLEEFGTGSIDLIEYTIPRNDEPPYANTNHIGMARAAMVTTDLVGDYGRMTAMGVEFLSAPVTRGDGQRFAIFKDLDGTFYDLVEQEGETKPDAPTQITHLGSLVFNVSDYERSAAWYRMMGYELDYALPAEDRPEVAAAMGFEGHEGPIKMRGAVLKQVRDGSIMDLVQWIDPYDPSAPYPVPINHIGIARTALMSTNIEADVAMLEAQGVELVSPLTPCCSGDDASSYIIAFYDPDGTIVELASFPLVSKIFTVMSWFD